MDNSYMPEYSLEKDAFVGMHSYFFEKKLSVLASIAKEEQWNFKSPKYKDASNQKNFPILNNYLYFTYDKLKTEEGNAYLAKTVLPLDWAYMNSRRIVTPDADWITNILKSVA